VTFCIAGCAYGPAGGYNPDTEVPLLADDVPPEPPAARRERLPLAEQWAVTAKVNPEMPLVAQEAPAPIVQAPK
jgi:hypothetical protein